jgi:o-succinylbenzoate---CoA ligase
MNANQFLEQWNSEENTFFKVFSSGSTGTPKEIVLEKKWMIWSANQTIETLGLKNEKILCCLSLQSVGGLMMLARAACLQCKVVVLEPSIQPLKNLPLEHDFTFVSLTPLQLHTILENKEEKEKLSLFKNVLIGGASLSLELEQRLQGFTNSFWHSYGMSETYSHIALRKVNGANKQNSFYPFKEVGIYKEHDGSLTLRVPFFSNLLYTNDLIEHKEDNSFVITGRKDFVINSGGLKINPEELEQDIIRLGILSENTFAISSRPDKLLGQKLVLVHTIPKLENDLFFEKMRLNFKPAFIPKEIVYFNQLPYTHSGKISRNKMKELLSLQA